MNVILNMADRQKAIDYRDAAGYLKACTEEGIEPELQGLHEQGLAELVVSEMQKSPRERGIPRNYGIRRKDLAVLGKTTLKHIFYGIHNIDIPDEMLESMNPDEILTKYYSAGAKKYNNNHLRNPEPEDFVTLTKDMDRQAYPMIGVMARDAKKRLPHGRLDQRARLDSLPDRVKYDFVESFFSYFIRSTREAPHDPDSFYNRNMDGDDKEVYATDIYRFFEHKWKTTEKK
jgi:hypothetical protein